MRVNTRYINFTRGTSDTQLPFVLILHERSGPRSVSDLLRTWAWSSQTIDHHLHVVLGLLSAVATVSVLLSAWLRRVFLGVLRLHCWWLFCQLVRAAVSASCDVENQRTEEEFILIIMYIYHALINALSAYMIHINLNMIFYTRVEHSPTKTIYIKYY